MAADWQQRMHIKACEAGFYADLAGASGWCSDEGENATDWDGLHPTMHRFAENRRGVFEYHRLDALKVGRSGYLGDYAKACANSKDLKKQIDVADFLASPESARAAGLEVIVDVSENQLGKAEFFVIRAEGVEKLLLHGIFATRRDAELEWMMREAEVETGFLRDDPNPSRRKAVRRKYRNFCNRDRK